MGSYKLCTSSDLNFTGLARSLSDKYGWFPRLKRHKLKSGDCFAKRDRCAVVFLVTKLHPSDPSSQDHLESS